MIYSLSDFDNWIYELGRFCGSWLFEGPLREYFILICGLFVVSFCVSTIKSIFKGF